MDKIIRQKTFINSELDGSGKLLSERSRTITYFDEDKGYLFWLNKEAVKAFKGYGLPDCLSETETGRIYRLSLATHKGSNLICFRSGNVVKAMGLVHIGKFLRITTRAAANFINRMIGLRIIGKVRVRIGQRTETQFYLNPIYFFNGKWLNYNLYFLFKKDLDGILPDWVKEKFNADLTEKGRSKLSDHG